MLNSIQIMGRIAKDIELRSTPTGKKVVSFSIACEKDTKDREAEFFEIVAWENTAEFIHNYFAKGKLIVIDGRLQSRSFEDKQGNKRRVNEILAKSAYFCGSKNDDSSKGRESKNGETNGFKMPIGGYDDEFAEISAPDDELPF